MFWSLGMMNCLLREGIEGIIWERVCVLNILDGLMGVGIIVVVLFDRIEIGFEFWIMVFVKFVRFVIWKVL